MVGKFEVMSPLAESSIIVAGCSGTTPRDDPCTEQAIQEALELKGILDSAEVAQGWDSPCPRPLRRGDWDLLPDDVQCVLDNIDLWNRQQTGLTANFDQLPRDHQEQHSYQLDKIQDYLCEAATTLWVREAKSILLNTDGEAFGVAEYQIARWALTLVSSITEKIGAENVTPRHQISQNLLLLSALKRDEAFFLKAIQDQIAAGDVQFMSS